MGRSKLREAFPHLSMLFLGTALMTILHPILGIFYPLYFIGATAWFWWRICTNCLSYGNRGCPSGYGTISSKLFRRAEVPDFRKAFRNNIGAIVIQFFIPPVAAVVFLILPNLSWFHRTFGPAIYYPAVVLILGIYSFVAFVWIPIHSRSKACDTCPQSVDCVWKKK
mgnify:CR=1 FL=1